MNSSQMGAQADMLVAERPRRVSPLLICIAFFVLLEVLQPFLTQLEAPYFKAIPMPPGAPPSWWHVDKSLALIGSVNLILMIGPAYLYYLLRGRKFSSLGFNRGGTAIAWILMLVVQGAVLALDTRMGALGRAPGALGPYALLASAIVAPCAGFSEETLFRGFMMEELRRGGFGALPQIAISSIFFALAHYSFVFHFTLADLSIPIFTGVLGAFYAFIYLVAKRSLWPTVVAHMINDAVLIPSVFYLIAQRSH